MGAPGGPKYRGPGAEPPEKFFGATPLFLSGNVQCFNEAWTTLITVEIKNHLHTKGKTLFSHSLGQESFQKIFTETYIFISDLAGIVLQF